MLDQETTVALPDRENTASSEAAPTKKVGFISLGCPKNLVDSEVMMGMLTHAGADLTPRAEDADIIVVNTCSFIDSAQQESVNTILEMAKLKNQGRARKLVVAGCLVERFRDEIRKNIPEVDAVVGTGELENILAAAGVAPPPQSTSPFKILTSRAEGNAREVQGRFSREGWDGAISDLPNYLYDETTPRVLATPSHTAYIKIAEGCDHPCTFCIIPQLRGKFRSRRFESVVAEAERLAQQGVREITLIGQDTTCYGEDFGLKDGLALLLEKLARIEPLRWVRFLYAYPNKITGRLLETIAAHEKICSCASSRRCGGRFPALHCGCPSSWAFRARRKKNSRNFARSCAKHNSTGWARSDIPIRTARAHTRWRKSFRPKRLNGAVNASCRSSDRSAKSARRP